MADFQFAPSKLLILSCLVALTTTVVGNEVSGIHSEQSVDVTDGSPQRNEMVTATRLPTIFERISDTRPYNDTVHAQCGQSTMIKAVEEFTQILSQGTVCAFLCSSKYVWALEGKGYSLLKIPYNFERISLGTLSPGVYHYSADENCTFAPECIQNMTKTASENDAIIAQFINEAARRAIDSLLENEILNYQVYKGKNYETCVEPKTPFDVYECWLGGSNRIQNESIIVERYMYGWLIKLIVGIGCALGAYSPLAILLITQNSPPVEIEGELYLSRETELPVGLTYLLLHSYGNINTVVTIRRVFGIVLAAGVTIYLQNLHFTCYVSNTFRHRAEIIISSLIGLISLIAIGWCFLQHHKDTSQCTEGMLKKEEHEWSSYFDSFSIFKIDPHNTSSPISNNKNISFSRRYAQILHHRAFIIFPSMLKWPDSFSCKCTEWCERYFPLNHSVLKGFFLILSIPLYIVPYLFSIPVLHLFFGLIRHYLGVRMKIWICLHHLAPLVFFFIVASGFILIAEICLYTIIGLIINYKEVGYTFIAIITAIVLGVSVVADFYDKYRRLFRIILTKAQYLEQQTQQNNRSTYNDNDANRKSTADNPSISDDSENTRLVTSERNNNTSNNQFSFFKYIDGDDVPHISKKLYDKCIEKCQPIYFEVMKKFLLIGSVMIAGVALLFIMKETEQMNELPAIVTFFLPAIIAGIIPVINNILVSREKQICDEEILSQRIESVFRRH